jgi:hypothetical protein
MLLAQLQEGRFCDGDSLRRGRALRRDSRRREEQPATGTASATKHPYP